MNIINEFAILPAGFLKTDYNFFLFLYEDEFLDFRDDAGFVKGLSDFLRKIGQPDIKLSIIDFQPEGGPSVYLIPDFSPEKFRNLCRGNAPGTDTVFEIYLAAGTLKCPNNHLIIYFDRGSEAVIAAVKKRLSDKFREIVKPYEEFSFEKKLDWVYNTMIGEARAKSFIQMLIDSYFKDEANLEYLIQTGKLFKKYRK
jgi:hypothetical protein